MQARLFVAFAIIAPVLIHDAHSQCVNTEVEHWPNPDPAINDQYGTSVAIGGDWAVVGVSLDTEGVLADCGSVYVYHRVGSIWSFSDRLLASDAAAGDEFGIGVALDGDVLVVGARSADVSTKWHETGAAYVFERETSGWTQKAKLQASDYDHSTTPYFGDAVSISGDTIVVGAYADDEAGNPGDQDCGKAYVFVKPTTGWDAPTTSPMTETRILVAHDPSSDARFGSSVAIEGGIVAVGAIFAHSTAHERSGTVHVYVEPMGGWGSGASALTEDARLEPQFSDGEDKFGRSVSIDSGDIAVGASDAKSDVVSSAPRTGAVYVFNEPGGGWSTAGRFFASPTIVPPDLATHDLFGNSLEFRSSRIVVGAPLHAVGTVSQAGQVYLFARNGVTWSQTHWLRASNASAADTFGASVAIDGDSVLVGAIVDDVLAVHDAGSAYRFDISKCSALTYCFGDGSSGACPCANESSPGSGAGCQHSGGGGAKLELSGVVSASPVRLTCSGLPTNAPCILLRYPMAAPTPFLAGDGLGCLGTGPFVIPTRVQTAVGATATFVTPQAAPGHTRYFQVSYRDPNVGFCTPSFVNHSNGLALEW